MDSTVIMCISLKLLTDEAFAGDHKEVHEASGIQSLTVVKVNDTQPLAKLCCQYGGMTVPVEMFVN